MGSPVLTYGTPLSPSDLGVMASAKVVLEDVSFDSGGARVAVSVKKKGRPNANPRGVMFSRYWANVSARLVTWSAPVARPDTMLEPGMVQTMSGVA